MNGPDFEGVLAAHVAWGGEDEFDHCECGWTPGDESTEPFADHRYHLSAALHAEVARWLADEGTREVVARALADRNTQAWMDPEWDLLMPIGRDEHRRDARAALAALTTTTQEDQP